MKVSASAPGKLFLLGEYAVLAGECALLMAVDRRARVNIRPGQRTRVRIRAAEERDVTIEEATILGAALDVLSGRGLLDPQALEDHAIELDTGAFYQDGKKLGVGSSAALMVAIIRALSSQTLSNEALLDLARECHSVFQGGRGSGGDIAASMMGGCIRFERGRFPSPVDLPDDLHMLMIWTGRSASTPRYVSGFEKWRARHPGAAERLVGRLGGICRGAIDDLGDRQTEAFIGKVRQFNQGLAELSDVTGLGFYSPEHVLLRDLVEAHGLVYKPSGAGGGDFGMACTVDADRQRRLEETLNNQGYLTLSPVVGRASEVCFED